jgi:hypothetical protein
LLHFILSWIGLLALAHYAPLIFCATSPSAASCLMSAC